VIGPCGRSGGMSVPGRSHLQAQSGDPPNGWWFSRVHSRSFPYPLRGVPYPLTYAPENSPRTPVSTPLWYAKLLSHLNFFGCKEFKEIEEIKQFLKAAIGKVAKPRLEDRTRALRQRFPLQ
jgi:hypothetical protein